MRFPIRLGLMRPLLRLIKVKPETAYVELDDEGMSITFGYVGARIPYANIASVEARKWPFINGIGLRISLGGTMGYIGAYGQAVFVQLHAPQDLKAGPGPMSIACQSVAVSVTEPTELLEELRTRIGSG